MKVVGGFMVVTETKYNALVVDPDTGTRLRLKQAAISVYHFGEVHLCPDLDNALARLEGGKQSDVVFISERFPKDQIPPFIKQAKGTAGGNDAAYVLVLTKSEDDSARVASGVMLGADGVLMEPYSVDSLVEITKLSARVKRENARTREKAAISFLVKDIIKQIDRLAYMKVCEMDVGRSLKQFREMCSVFENFDDNSRQMYFEIMLELFDNLPPPKYPVRQYKGASLRVKKMMEKKLLEQFNDGTTSDEKGEQPAPAAEAAGKSR